MSDHNALDTIRALAGQIVDAAIETGVWRWGDGHGGIVWAAILDAAAERGLTLDTPTPTGYVKAPIPLGLRLRVFQRDGYRCLRCGETDINQLRADHVRPESKGGSTTLDNLQTLCAPCNSAKGTNTVDYREAEQ